MVDRVLPLEDLWASVDAFIGDRLLGEDSGMVSVLAANAAAGLPEIDVSAPQGKLLRLLVRMTGARRVLEVGTLGGYSTIWMAGALPAGGRLVTLEIEPRHAEAALANITRAGFADRVDIRVGPASETLAAMVASGSEQFDLVFIDADKESGVAYLEAAMAMSRPGTVIIVDNVVREGAILDPAHSDPRVRGTRALFDAVAAEPRLTATAVQTVGSKKWDGFLLAMVD